MVTDDETEYYQSENEFATGLDFFTLPYDKEGTGIKGVFSVDPDANLSTHIIDKLGNGTRVVTTSGGVLLGKMSFQMTADTFDKKWFNLEPLTNTAPETGIKINIDDLTYFDLASGPNSTFVFGDKTASKDADLTQLIVSSGQKNNVDPTQSTYKEYTLTPTFVSGTKQYTLTLLEYIDTLDIKASLSDQKATMKINFPKRNANDELEYDTSGTTIVYDQDNLSHDVPYPVKINKLGEPDTKITIDVTAEDGVTKTQYELVIKRPYGTIKGSIYMAPLDTKPQVATVKIYNSSDVSQLINWGNMTAQSIEKLHANLLTLKSKDENTKSDGTYEIKVIPGQYDILLDRDAYLDHIYTSKIVNDGDVIDLGHRELFVGDLNKDGTVQIKDISEQMKFNKRNSTDPDYNIRYDFNEDGQIQIKDISFLRSNNKKSIVIE